MVSLMVILLSTKCFLFVHMYIDLLKLKAYINYLKIAMLASPGFFFKEANLHTHNSYDKFLVARSPESL